VSLHLLSNEICISIPRDAEYPLSSLLKTLFPLLPRTTSSSLRAIIRKTILTDIKTANQRTKNHKLNRAVQAMLFGMVERGMGGTVMGDKGKLRSNPSTSVEGLSSSGDEAMWAMVLTKELWKKGIWCVSSSSYQVVVIDKCTAMTQSLLPSSHWDAFIPSPRSRARRCTSSLVAMRRLRIAVMRATTT
jgi:hypothetical protein